MAKKDEKKGLDNLDRKLLYYLSSNSRNSIKNIGKQAGVSRVVADYRIKRMVERK